MVKGVTYLYCYCAHTVLTVNISNNQSEVVENGLGYVTFFHREWM